MQETMALWLSISSVGLGALSLYLGMRTQKSVDLLVELARRIARIRR
jgi:hypothetical protein